MPRVTLLQPISNSVSHYGEVRPGSIQDRECVLNTEACYSHDKSVWACVLRKHLWVSILPMTEVAEVIFPVQYSRASLKSSIQHIYVIPVCTTQIGVCLWKCLHHSIDLCRGFAATLVLISSFS